MNIQKLEDLNEERRIFMHSRIWSPHKTVLTVKELKDGATLLKIEGNHLVDEFGMIGELLTEINAETFTCFVICRLELDTIKNTWDIEHAFVLIQELHDKNYGFLIFRWENCVYDFINFYPSNEYLDFALARVIEIQEAFKREAVRLAKK